MTDLHVLEAPPNLSPKEEVTARLAHFLGSVQVPETISNEALAKLLVVVISDFIPMTAEYAVAGEHRGEEFIDVGGSEAPLTQDQATFKATQFYPGGRVVRRFVTDFS